jgi:hypothetical protein
MMKKLTLKLDALRVESFTTAGASSARGTVRSYFATYPCTDWTKDCTWDCEYTDSCEPTTEMPSKGQNNCTTLNQN